MSADAALMTVLAAVGGAGAAAVTALWHTVTSTAKATDKRLTDCEEDREKLHATVSEHSSKLAKLEGFIDGQKIINADQHDTNEQNKGPAS